MNQVALTRAVSGGMIRISSVKVTRDELETTFNGCVRLD